MDYKQKCRDAVEFNKQNMITEDYVSFEVAKLLKEKGYCNISNTLYKGDGKFIHYDVGLNNKGFSTTLGNFYEAPTHQMALKWLREKCDIYVEIIFYSITKPVLYRWCASKNGRVVSDEEKPDTNVVKCFIHGDDKNFTIHYCTYEDAVEAAIKYCLTNLI